MTDAKPDTEQETMSQRERRRQHYEQTKPKVSIDWAGFLKKWGWPIAILVLIGGVTAGIVSQQSAAADCPTHWHSTFQVYVPDEADPSMPVALDFQEPYFDISRDPYMSEAMHLHQSDGKNQFHFEQGGICVSVKEAFDILEVDMTKDSMTAGGYHEVLGQDGHWKNGNGGSLHMLVRDVEGNWAEQSVSKVLGYQLKDGEGLLVYFGDFTDDQVAAMQASVAPVAADPNTMA